MATTTLVFSTQTLATPVGSVGLLQQVNLALQGVLDLTVLGFDFVIHDEVRRNGRYFDLVITYETPAVVPLTSPFVLEAVQAKSASEAVAALEAYKAANPGWWFSAIHLEFTGTERGAVSSPYVAWVVGSADPNAGDNWVAGGGGSGGGASDPVAVEGITAATTVDEVLVDSYRSVIWEVAAQDAAGNVRTSVIEAQHDGTALADATDADYTEIGLPDTGLVTGVFSVVLAGAGATQTMRLRFTPAAGTWDIAGWRRGIPIL